MAAAISKGLILLIFFLFGVNISGALGLSLISPIIPAIVGLITLYASIAVEKNKRWRLITILALFAGLPASITVNFLCIQDGKFVLNPWATVITVVGGLLGVVFFYAGPSIYQRILARKKSV